MTATLTEIRNKVRRITKNPSDTQLTTSQLDQYINTFYLYDFPEHLRLKDMLTNYTFATQPNQEAYELPIDPQSTDSLADPTAPSYTSIEPPVYIAGYESYFTQSQSAFYRLYPPIAIPNQIGTADGTVGAFALQLSNYPVMQNRVVISTLNANSSNLNVTDVPRDQVLYPDIGDLRGNTTYDAGDPTTYFPVTNYIDYVTGVINVTFDASTVDGSPINAQIVPYQASRPSAMLFYQNKMILRPIPDDSYQVSVQAYQTFTQFLNANPTATPYIKQWWQFIALGAALKIFEDNGDIDAIAQYRPLFDEQRCLAERRTLVEQANERAATIYTQQTSGTFGNFFGAL
jgi:hypothetical protein